jgi:L-arabinose isomerase
MSNRFDRPDSTSQRRAHDDQRKDQPLMPANSLGDLEVWFLTGSLVANMVAVTEPTAPLPNLPVGRAVWKPAPDFRTSATAWLTAGAAHHTVLSTAVGIEAFEDCARMARGSSTPF